MLFCMQKLTHYIFDNKSPFKNKKKQIYFKK